MILTNPPLRGELSNGAKGIGLGCIAIILQAMEFWVLGDV